MGQCCNARAVCATRRPRRRLVPSCFNKVICTFCCRSAPTNLHIQNDNIFLCVNLKMRNDFSPRPEFLLLLQAEATPLLWRARGDASGASFVFVLIWLILFVLCVRWINTHSGSSLTHSKMYNARTLVAHTKAAERIFQRATCAAERFFVQTVDIVLICGAQSAFRAPNWVNSCCLTWKWRIHPRGQSKYALVFNCQRS
jgi:hypothetical protein